MPPEQLNIADFFLGDRLREGRGDRVAVRGDESAHTYADIDRLANRFGNALRDAGVRQEERVIVALPDGPSFVGALFGILKLGAVVVMVNPELPVQNLLAILTYARPRAIVTSSASANPFYATGTPAHVMVVDGPAPDAHDVLDAVATHRDDPAIWLFSGGTTGAPKAVVQTHRSFVNTTTLYAQRALGYREDDITIAVPKLYFGYATGSNLRFPFSVGASAVLFDGRPTPEAIFERITRHRATILVNVPKVIAEMVNHPQAPTTDLSSLRLATSAGEALPPALYGRWVDMFGVELLDGLGTAEMWHIFVSNTPGDVRPGTLGRAVPGFDVRVRDDEGGDLAPGAVGRLWVRGGSRAIWYWQDLDRTAEAFRGEWFVSGDLVSADEEGYVTYVGRADDAMKVGGKWLLPAEVESCLLEHPAVAACAVVGVPDEAGLIKPVAFVVASGDSDALEPELREHVLEHLEPYKHPRRVIVVDDLPRTHLGKVDRGELRRRIST